LPIRSLRRDHAEQIWEDYRFSTHPWNVGVRANRARWNPHHRSYRLANQFCQCPCRASISCQFGERLGSQWQDDRQGWRPSEGQGHLRQVEWTAARPGQVTIRLTSIQLKDGKTLAVSTSGFHAKGKSHTKSNVTKIGGGAAAGALIGGLAGGGKGALIGTAVGAGAGTGVAAATGKEEAVIHSETAITFTTIANATAK
jgi:hypothetical protein